MTIIFVPDPDDPPMSAALEGPSFQLEAHMTIEDVLHDDRFEAYLEKLEHGQPIVLEAPSLENLETEKLMNLAYGQNRRLVLMPLR